MNKEIKALQGKLLNMLIKLDKYLTENKYEYFLIGGSALGAVRHGGFIPWDDDIDIAMPRNQFEEFERHAKGKIIDGLLYEPVEEHSFPEAPIGFLYDISDETIPLEECPCIDIFPLDGVPEEKSKRRKQKLYSYLYHISVLRQPSKNRGKKMAVLTGAFIKLTPDFMFEFYKRIAKKKITAYPYSKSENVANIFGMKRYDKEIMPKIFFGKPMRINFEGYQLPVPEKYHAYLSHLFGDYMQLPPPHLRQPHHMNLEWEG